MCHLKNVTYVVKKPELAEGSEGNENAEPVARKILGCVTCIKQKRQPAWRYLCDYYYSMISELTRRITFTMCSIYRGWQVDPITMRYKQMLFDDGDECEGTNERMDFLLEIVPTKNKEVKPRFYDFKQVNQCSFSAKLFTYVPPTDIKPFDGIHTSGVLDITDAQETLPQVCGQMMCKYNTISGKVRAVMTQVRNAAPQPLN